MTNFWRTVGTNFGQALQILEKEAFWDRHTALTPSNQTLIWNFGGWFFVPYSVKKSFESLQAFPEWVTPLSHGCPHIWLPECDPGTNDPTHVMTLNAWPHTHRSMTHGGMTHWLRPARAWRLLSVALCGRVYPRFLENNFYRSKWILEGSDMPLATGQPMCSIGDGLMFLACWMLEAAQPVNNGSKLTRAPKVAEKRSWLTCDFPLCSRAEHEPRHNLWAEWPTPHSMLPRVLVFLMLKMSYDVMILTFYYFSQSLLAWKGAHHLMDVSCWYVLSGLLGLRVQSRSRTQSTIVPP